MLIVGRCRCGLRCRASQSHDARASYWYQLARSIFTNTSLVPGVSLNLQLCVCTHTQLYFAKTFVKVLPRQGANTRNTCDLASQKALHNCRSSRSLRSLRQVQKKLRMYRANPESWLHQDCKTVPFAYIRPCA